MAFPSEMVDLGVTPKQKARARLAFQGSAERAGFYDGSPTRLVMPTGITPLNEDGTPREKATIKLPPSPPLIPPLQQNDHGGSGGGGGSDETQKLLEHPLVLGLFQDLARTDIVWTQAQHDEWLELAKLVLKRIHPIKQQGTDQ